MQERTVIAERWKTNERRPMSPKIASEELPGCGTRSGKLGRAFRVGETKLGIEEGQSN